MESIDLDDGLNGNWLAILRKLKKAKTKKEKDKTPMATQNPPPVAT